MFLPLAHVLARAVALAVVRRGCTARPHRRDIPNLVPTFGEFKPDFILVGAARVREGLQRRRSRRRTPAARARSSTRPPTTAVACSEAQDNGGAGLGLKAKHALFDKLVYSKLRAALGGQCQLRRSPAARRSAPASATSSAASASPIYEGYGLTETTAAVAVNTPGAQKVGTVGKPLAGNAVRIADDGEILLSGPVVFSGYWRNETATAEALEDGWFHTGDLGDRRRRRLHHDHRPQEGDHRHRRRQERLPRAARGLAPRAPADQPGHRRRRPAAVHRRADHHRPRGAARAGTSATASRAATTVADLVDDADLRRPRSRTAVDEANKLVSHAEAIKKFRILPVDFTEDTGELTPTLKLKRNVVHESFADDIEAIYAK